MAPSFLNNVIFRPPAFDSYCFRNRVRRLKTKRGNTIACTEVKRKNPSPLWVLFSHSNADDLNNCFEFMMNLSKILNVNVISYDYSGYGESTGTPNEENCYADIEAVFEYLTTKKRVASEHVLLFGRSLGSGPSCYLAAQCAEEDKAIAGVLLMSAFTSVYRLVVPDFMGVTLLGDAFPNIDRIGDIKAPIFIAHGEADNVVPLEHAQALREVLDRKRVEFFSHPEMAHNDIDDKVECEMMRSMNDFLDYYVLARRLWMKPAVARLHVCK